MNIGRISAVLAAVSLLWFAHAGQAAASDAPKEHVVKVVSDLDNFRMYFSPKHLEIRPGDTVTWVNEASIDHNVMTYPDGFPAGAEGFESPFLSTAGEIWSHRFTTEGTYEYHCLPHLIMGMHGTVVVGAPSKNSDFHQPSAKEVAAYRDRLLEYFDQEDIEKFSRSSDAGGQGANHAADTAGGDRSSHASSHQ